MQICISGIHTNTGKTHASAMLCKILKYDYYKLIQAGNPKDSQKILQFSPQTTIHKEGYFLKTPASPTSANKKKMQNTMASPSPSPLQKTLSSKLQAGSSAH
ncbi:dethiobiotin synthetase [Helicobacter mustelae]|nr:AAA family ATPase [Helicobacter mustelae]STP12519.1 dethiobiotin synthetase [Helicobacter mustelae]